LQRIDSPVAFHKRHENNQHCHQHRNQYLQYHQLQEQLYQKNIEPEEMHEQQHRYDACTSQFWQQDWQDSDTLTLCGGLEKVYTRNLYPVMTN
jgi:hypothetical protein